MNKRKLPKPPKLSPDFTLKDIRKIRDYHYKLSQIQTPEEIAERRRKASAEVEKIIAEKRAAGIKPVYPKRIEI
ncbi:MAG: hypothetical protein LBM59_00520 [Ruminococcus sp.]|jgi:hypothetical protein|nr:hypothetical protein [Ruminococcus sp.]